MKNKKVVLVIQLVEESTEVSNEEIEREILQALSEEQVIPWLKSIEKVTVIEE